MNQLEVVIKRTNNFNPPDTVSNLEFLENLETQTRRAMDWLYDDAPDFFNVKSVVFTLEFDSEISNLTGDENYTSSRGQILTVGKTLRQTEGAIVVFNLEAYPLTEAMSAWFLCIHESFHARHHIHFDPNVLMGRSLPEKRAICFAETIFDEYACDRGAFRILDSQSGIERIELQSLLEDQCLGMLDSCTDFSTVIRAEAIAKKFSMLNGYHGNLSESHFSQYVQEVTQLAHEYWISAIHCISFMDHFGLWNGKDLSSFNHNTFVAHKFVEVI